ncbi:MAG: twin-arginine translocase subunit TatC [Bacteroidetes bacterium]|nr:twin-arginine translocase subunit TatC [Bacteroidota bacterium]
MTFLDHLEELRWNLIRGLIAIIACTIFVFVHKYFVFEHILLAPKSPEFLTFRALCKFSHLVGLGDRLCLNTVSFTVINIKLAGQFLMHIKSSFVLGFVLSSPYIIWEVWRFIKPALHKKEKRYSRGMVFYCSSLFIIGVLFGYFILTPFSVNFLGTYNVSRNVANTIDLGSFISTLTSLVLVSGIIFELPIFTYFLSKIGLVTPTLMRKYRKHALIVILIVSAIITPPDVISQLIIWFPLYFLFEISILISARVVRRQEV